MQYLISQYLNIKNKFISNKNKKLETRSKIKIHFYCSILLRFAPAVNFPTPSGTAAKRRVFQPAFISDRRVVC